MGTIASLTVDLNANVAGLRRDLGKSQAMFKGWGRDVRRSVDSASGSLRQMRNGLAALGIGIGIREIGQFVKASLDAVGGLGELSEQLGVSTRNLQIYQFAATQAGVSTSQLEAGLGILTRRIGEAAQGEKEALDAFNELGVGVLDASGKLRTTDEVLRDVADAMAGIEDPAKRGALAADLMGRSGQRLLPILSRGSQQLDEFAMQAERAGAVLTDDMIATADVAADKWAALDFAWAKASQRIAVSLVPALTAATDALAGLLKPMTHEEQQALAALIGMSAAAENLPFSTGSDRGTTAETGSAGAAGGTSNPPIAGGGLSDAERAAQKIQATADALRFQAEQLGRTAVEQARYNALAQAGIDITHASAAEIMRLADVVESRTDGLAMFNENLEAEAEKLADVQFRLEGASIGYKLLAEQSRELRDATEDMARSLEQTFGRSLAQIATDFDNWKDIAVNAIGEVFDSLYQLYALQSQQSGGTGSLIGDLFSFGIGSLFGGGSSYAPGVGPGGMGFLNFGGPRAEGGPVFAGSAYMVGEEGPELFTPGRSGAIVPNGKMGGDTYYVINAPGASKEELMAVRRELIVLAGPGATERRAMNATADARMRGGSFAETFA